jgi:hypothetical protein
MSDAPITQKEMIELFGEAMPIEAVNLIWNGPDDMTVGECRAKLREIAAKEANPVKKIIRFIDKRMLSPDIEEMAYRELRDKILPYCEQLLKS